MSMIKYVFPPTLLKMGCFSSIPGFNMGTAIEWKPEAERLNLVNFQVNDWTILMDRKLHIDPHSEEPWSCLTVLLNTVTNECILRCLQDTVFRSELDSSEAFALHCKTLFEDTEVKTLKSSGVPVKVLFNKSLRFEVKMPGRMLSKPFGKKSSKTQKEVNDVTSDPLKSSWEEASLPAVEPKPEIMASSNFIAVSVKDEPICEETVEEEHDQSEAKPLDYLNLMDIYETDAVPLEFRSPNPLCESTEDTTDNFESECSQQKELKVLLSCHICNSAFLEEQEMENHVASEHGKYPYFCSPCQKAFVQKCHFEDHQHNAHVTGKFPCQVCKEQFDSSDDYVIHVKKLHIFDEAICPKCGLKFSPKHKFLLESFGKHYRCCIKGSKKPPFAPETKQETSDDHDEEFQTKNQSVVRSDCSSTQCDICGKSKKKKELHMERAHGVYRFPCKDCDFETEDSILFVTHQQQAHGKSHVDCPRCKESVSCSENLFVQHMVSCMRKFIKANRTHCKLCDYKANSYNALMTHVSIAHPSSQPAFSCPHCEYKTLVKTHMRLHEKIHIRQDLINQGKQSYPDGTPLFFYCDKCPKKFATKNEVRRHNQRRHLNEVKQCQVSGCDYTCMTKSAMDNHILKVHSTDPSSKCPQCDFRGSNLSLKKHMILHGPPRFSCQVCGKQLRSKSSLEDHIKTHTGERPHKYVRSEAY